MSIGSEHKKNWKIDNFIDKLQQYNNTILLNKCSNRKRANQLACLTPSLNSPKRKIKTKPISPEVHNMT